MAVGRHLIVPAFALTLLLAAASLSRTHSAVRLPTQELGWQRSVACDDPAHEGRGSRVGGGSGRGSAIMSSCSGRREGLSRNSGHGVTLRLRGGGLTQTRNVKLDSRGGVKGAPKAPGAAVRGQDRGKSWGRGRGWRGGSGGAGVNVGAGAKKSAGPEVGVDVADDLETTMLPDDMARLSLSGDTVQSLIDMPERVPAGLPKPRNPHPPTRPSPRKPKPEIRFPRPLPETRTPNPEPQTAGWDADPDWVLRVRSKQWYALLLPSSPTWRQPRGKSQVNLPQMLPPGGSN